MRQVTHEWAGEPHESESVKRIDGVEVARNLVPNPSFETGVLGWTGNSVDIERSSEWSASGDYSAKATPNGTSLDSRIDISGFGSLPAGTYTMRGTIRLAALQGDRQHPRARRLVVFHRESSSGSYTVEESEQAPNETGEHDLELTFTIPEGHTHQLFRLYHGEDKDSGTGGPVWWDAVSITAEPHDYFDGDTPAYYTPSPNVTYEWAGEPHASESIKRKDGVEVARNLVPNPSFEVDLSGIHHSSTQMVRRPFANSYAGEHVLDFEIQDDGYGFPGRIMTNADVNSVSVGQWIAVAVRIRRRTLPSDTQARLVLNWNDSSGSTLDSMVGPREDVGWDWTTITVASQKPAGAVNINLRIQPESGAETRGGFGHTDGWHASAADTEAEALAQVETYFDGDTEDYFSRIVFKVWANGKWRPIEPKAYVDGMYIHGGMS